MENCVDAAGKRFVDCAIKTKQICNLGVKTINKFSYLNERMMKSYLFIFLQNLT